MARLKMKLPAEQRDMLHFLATSARGCTEALLMAHGFKLQTIVALITAGLATASTEPVGTRRRTINVTRVRITDAGRRLLETE